MSTKRTKAVHLTTDQHAELVDFINYEAERTDRSATNTLVQIVKAVPRFAEWKAERDAVPPKQRGRK